MTEQSPTQYEERPPSVTAMEFVGTADSAFQITSWLSNYGAVVMFDAARSRVVIQTSTNDYITVENGCWVLLDKAHKITSMKDSDFRAKYDVTEAEPVATPTAPEPPPVVETPEVPVVVEEDPPA